MAEPDEEEIDDLVDDFESDTTSDFEDLIAKRYLGEGTLDDATKSEQKLVRDFIDAFYELTGNLDSLYDELKKKEPILSSQQRYMLDYLLNDPQFATEIIEAYRESLSTDAFGDLLKSGRPGDEDDLNLAFESRGYKIFGIIEAYKEYKARQVSENPPADEWSSIEKQIEAMGPFTPSLDHIDSYRKLREQLNIRSNRFRDDDPPAAIRRFQCRIGGSTFLIPPTNINVSQSFYTGSLTGGAIRARNSPKTNLGHSDTTVTMQLYFPNHESIWGFSGKRADFDIFNWDPQPTRNEQVNKAFGDVLKKENTVADETIDQYLSSLRGLITQFKYSPFLPIRNEYLNRTYGITGVTMNNLTVSTMPEYPFVIVVTLQMNKFNFTPYLPMIQDFDQAIHWGKFRQYMGRAAHHLEQQVGESFLKEVPIVDEPSDLLDLQRGGLNTPTETVQYTPALFDKVRDIYDGRNFNIYYPKGTPARIFAPDTTDFRQPGEDDMRINKDIWDGILSEIGLDLVEGPDFNFFEYSNARETYASERNLLTAWLASNKVAYSDMSTDKMYQYIAEEIEKAGDQVTESNLELVTSQLKSLWFYTLFDSLMRSNSEIKRALQENEDSGQYVIKEWEVPMEQMYMDWSKCIVQGVAVSLSNNYARLQIQLQDEPTYQHIGGGDSVVSVSMVVMDEDNLIRLRRVFEHINGLARLEQAHGVLGYLGIKNVLTSLCGIKYVLPSSFEVDTVPNQPHVYVVNMSFVDFDVRQQQREELNFQQQADLAEKFGKRNPFLRLKQSWNIFNAYPDMPLDVRDEGDNLLGHLDPDWYFRSFQTIDKDVYNWGVNQEALSLVKRYSALSDEYAAIKEYGDDTTFARITHVRTELNEIEAQLRTMVEENAADLPPGWDLENGDLRWRDSDDPSDFGEAEMRIYMGAYGEDQEFSTFIDFFAGGLFAIGEENTQDETERYLLRMATFREDLASKNLEGKPTIPGTVGLAEYQNEYKDGDSSPNAQFEWMMQDFNYRNLKGRMLRAFPTYMLWLIDEGGMFAGIKLYDNFYGLNSVIDFSVVQSDNSLDDTLVLRLSNIYQKLTTPHNEGLINEDDPLYETPIGRWITTMENRHRNLESGLTNKIIELNHIRLKPGVRIHLRAGYGSDPNALQTVFNGTITEVQQGDIMTVVAQSDAVELTAMVNTTDAKGSSGKLDGGMSKGFWLSEPRDLIVRLLTMGSSYFKEWLSWGSKGVIFSESRFGIRHFGGILYEEMTSDESASTTSVFAAAMGAGAQLSNRGKGDAGEFSGLGSRLATELSEIDSVTALPSLFTGEMSQLAQLLWANSFSTRDYELFKRNIYPGNGTGVAQYMGGDMIDGGNIMGITTAHYKEYDDDDTIRTPYSGPITSIDSLQDLVDSQGRRVVNPEDNAEYVDLIWKKYRQANSLDDQELIDLLSTPLTNSSDLTAFRRQDDEGLLEDLINNDLVRLGLGAALFAAPIPGSRILGGLLVAPIVGDSVGWLSERTGLDSAPVIGQANDVIGFMGEAADAIVHTPSRLVNSPIGKLLGLSPAIEDDDLSGYNETSFRAQTYMKTVWDLFKVCAALQPNYIVAVRPFEDRSTVFYGKPHWLYTSGVIPVTTGLPKKLGEGVSFADPNEILSNILGISSEFNAGEKLARIAEESIGLKDIMEFSASRDMDPNAPGAGRIYNEEWKVHLQQQMDRFKDLNDGQTYTAIERIVATYDLTQFSQEDIENLFEVSFAGVPSGLDIDLIWDDAVEDFDIKYSEIKNSNNETYNLSTKEVVGSWLAADFNNIDKWTEQAEGLGFSMGPDELNEFAEADPLAFAFHFGWRFSWVPAYVDPISGFGEDIVGSLARAQYDEEFSDTVDATGDGRTVSEAVDIWRDLRIQFRQDDEAKEIFMRYHELEEHEEAFQETLDLFMRFLWQDPFNRAWVVSTVSRKKKGINGEGGFLGIGGDNSREWTWGPIYEAFEIFIQTPIKIDDSGVPKNGSARRYMEANNREGSSASGLFSGTIEGAGDWFDNNVGQVLSLVQDSLTGLLASIRLSLAQLGNALSQSGQMQQQANILNAVLMDSIYYQAGSPDSLLRLVDNPFTREYGEPVIEIREPFQRIHFVSSFDSILSNGIQENLREVPTVVTAVSDGKYPVTVHFDKGVPPDRQVEKIVETGIYWDNAVGSGLFGLLQPLIHPFETARAYSKAAIGSSDELTARRIALSHLRDGLKNIYTGELLIPGDADIRPYDLLYIADVYERMYGMVEVAQVTHHFTPENGFITSIVPNAIVTVNDPARWTMLSYVWSKMTDYNMRDDVRAAMAVRTDQTLRDESRVLTSDEVYKNFSTQINGAIQYTQGNTGIIKDFSAMFTGGGIERIAGKIAKYDIIIGALEGALPVTLGAAGALIGHPVGGVASGFIVSQLLSKAWDWVKENLFDQHGCYIQYLNKDGQPMDAGLSYYEGVAAGSRHTIDLFPNTIGLNSNPRDAVVNGHYRITTNDLLGVLGWTETETASLYRDTSLYLNQINANILHISNREPITVTNSDVAVFTAEVLPPQGGEVVVPGETEPRIMRGVIDGDTIEVKVIEGGGYFSAGEIVTVRMSAINTWELEYYNNPNTEYDEATNGPENDLGILAYNYLVNRFTLPSERRIAIRFDLAKPYDNNEYRRLVGVIFHNTPLGTPNVDRLDVLKAQAERTPTIPFDAFMDDGRPYTLNWEMVMTGYGNVDMRESLWDTSWRKDAIMDIGGQ